MQTNKQKTNKNTFKQHFLSPLYEWRWVPKWLADVQQLYALKRVLCCIVLSAWIDSCTDPLFSNETEVI